MRIGQSLANRMTDAGVDTQRLAHVQVLIRVNETLRAAELHGHPVKPLCLALARLGIGAVNLCGGCEFFGELTTQARGALQHFPGKWHAVTSPFLEPSPGVIVDLALDETILPAPGDISMEPVAHHLQLRWGQGWVGMHAVEQGGDFTMPAMAGAGERPSAPVAWIAAGLVLQEIVLRVGGIAQTCMPAPWVTYDARSESRTFESSTRETSSAGIKHAILDVIGAGAVGSHVLECLCPLLTDCDLRIFDPDFVAPENLCLSPLYREEDVGEFKANAAAKRLAARVGGDVRVHPFAMRYEERSSELEPASVRIACVDTFAARKALNDISLRDGVPLVESGSSPLAGQVRAYLPGRTACLAHRILRLDQKAATEIDSASCLRSPAPTLPGVNMVVAGMQVVEAVRTLRPDQTGGPSPGTVMFDGREPERFGVTAVRAPCQHSVFRRKGADTRNAVRR